MIRVKVLKNRYISSESPACSFGLDMEATDRSTVKVEKSRFFVCVSKPFHTVLNQTLGSRSFSPQKGSQ